MLFRSNAHQYGRGYARKRGDATEAREDAHLAALWGGPKKKKPVDPTDPIQHVVVLMMENRSFDHMLGGIRHLIWDTGRGFGAQEREWMAVANLVGSVGLTIVLWFVGYLVMGGIR